MHTLQWSDALSLDMPLMDETHREFVDLLACAAGADDDALLPAWHRLIEHTQDHFDREDLWMTQTGFSATHCHMTQHKVVLQVMREGERRGHEGDLALVRRMAGELGQWFAQHAQSMDAALALHMRRSGFEPQADTGETAQDLAPALAAM